VFTDLRKAQKVLRLATAAKQRWQLLCRGCEKNRYPRCWKLST